MRPERSEACNSASCITLIAQPSKNNWNHYWDRFLWAVCPENAMVDCTYSGYGERVTYMFGTKLRKIDDSRYASKLFFLPMRNCIACENALLWVSDSRITLIATMPWPHICPHWIRWRWVILQPRSTPIENATTCDCYIRVSVLNAWLFGFPSLVTWGAVTSTEQ